MTGSIHFSHAGSSVPDMPGPISGQVNVCAYVSTGQRLTYSISPVAGAEVYLWTVPPTTTLVSGQGTTSITVSINNGFTNAANKQIKVRAISQDGNSQDRILYLSAQQPSTPASITGPNNACIYVGTPNTAVYTVSKDPAASGYIWGTDSRTTIVTHPNGPGVNDTVIHVAFKANFQTSTISAQAVNSCGYSSARLLNVSGNAPSQPGVISGPTNACSYLAPNGNSATYSINPVAGAGFYTWIVPDECEVTHNNGPGTADVSITVRFPADFTSGSITVIANSGCDESAPRSLAISKLTPGTPGAITATEQSICPNREFQYKLPAMPTNTNSVNWTVPADAISFSGQGTTTITVQYPDTRVSGTVTATGVNSCASSATRQSVINLYRCQNERMAGTNTSMNRGTIQGQPKTNVKGTATTGRQSQTTIAGQAETKINIGPNPSKGSFKLQVSTINKENINVRVLDLQGREVKKISIKAGQPLVFGNDLKPGTYVVEITQGNFRQTEKLLKL